ncbi:hypothetical protein LCGC14_2021020 [marine sediment metagenome]|uniref:Uncharacterized protein n=1 Tax=marine sediment metagenome TaxID=412755 RepID=A0A0F9HUN7_9ZZZZ
MDNKKIVYVVCVGEYSDYGISGIFSNKCQAEKAAKLVDGEIEEYMLNPDGFIDPGLDCYTVEMNKDGTYAIHNHSRLYEHGDKHTTFIQFRTNKDIIILGADKYNISVYNDNHTSWKLFWKGYVRSEKHAIRETNEIRRYILAGQKPKNVDMGKN